MINSEEDSEYGELPYTENRTHWLYLTAMGIPLVVGCVFLFSYSPYSNKVISIDLPSDFTMNSTPSQNTSKKAKCWNPRTPAPITSRQKAMKKPAVNAELPKHIRDCVPFYSLIADTIAAKIGKIYWPKTDTIALVGAYAYLDYSVITHDALGWYGQKVYCRYFDVNWKELGSVESVAFPEFAVHCCTHPRAAYMTITEREYGEATLTVPVCNRTVDDSEPKYILSVCLSPLYGTRSKWLMLAEFVEHYKLQGMQHFYIYVADIDKYSRLLLDDFAKRGEAEVVYFRKERGRNGKSWQLVGAEDCMHRSRHHSRYAVFQDLDERIITVGNQTLAKYIMEAMTERPNIGMLQFRSTWIVCTKKPPDKYEGEEALKNHLPTLVYHKTSDVEPSGIMAKCALDTRRVLLFMVHAVYVYFPGFKSACAPPDRAIIRHYRDLTFNDARTKKLRGYPGYAPWLQKMTSGNFTITRYPSNLMKQLYANVKKRLERVYR